MVDFIKALALLVEIVIEPVRVPATATKMDVGMTPPPPQKVAQWSKNRTSVEDQLMIAELRLYKNRKKKKKKKKEFNSEKKASSYNKISTFK